MRSAVLALAALALPCVVCADEPPRAARDSYANPSALIAAEIAFAQLARDKGQWTAFRETATKEAEMFVPQRVLAQHWLKKKSDPRVALRWQPHEAWISCDGSYGVTRGAWQGSDATGYFTTVWQRQPKQGDYKWILDQGDRLQQPLAAPEMLAGHVASCAPGAGPVPVQPPAQGVDSRDGASPDKTLQWSSQVWTDGARLFTVWMWNGRSFDVVVNSAVKAPG